ncbi:MAG: nuclear transport factor 2 family protein [Pseudomonadota bacterium]
MKNSIDMGDIVLRARRGAVACAAFAACGASHALAQTGGQTAGMQTTCAKGDDQRVIEIVSPGDVGRMCDVKLTYVASSVVKVPYHANNSRDFCAMKAQDLISSLSSQGFACAPASAVSVTAAPQTPAQQVDEPTPQARFQPAPTTFSAEAAPSGNESYVDPGETITVVSKAGAPRVADLVTEESAAGEERITAKAAAPDIDGLSDRLNDVLDGPQEDAFAAGVERHAANRGPARLTDNADPNISGAGRARVVGRLVGAAPADEPAPRVELAAATPASTVSLDAGSAAVTPEATALATAPKAEPPEQPKPVVVARAETPAETAKSRRRNPKDIIRATLAAQAAAWNEGNLEAFMDTYSRDDGLKMVSADGVAKGWSSTMKRYRNNYADGDGMGQLGLDRLDVEMIADDVAIVTGRFNVARADASDSGFFSLVMKRNDGAWRIVHDHTTSTPRKE